MKIFFDARYIEPDFHNGISRYSAELGNALARLENITFIIHDRAQLKLLPKNAKSITIHRPTSTKEPFTSLILNKYNPDVVFSPMQTMGTAGRKFKLILTQHDMIYYQFPKPPAQFNLLIKIGWRLYHMTYVPGRMALNGADVVATVSETAKSELLAARLTDRPIEVISNAPEDLTKLTTNQVDLSKNPRNLVYMGSFIPYKNVELLLKSLYYLPEGYTLHLLSRISPKRKAELTQLIPKNKKVIFHGGVSDEKYAEILADNAIMVSASKNEGFGLPLVEAIKMGTPCVVTDLPVFREVGGNGALYFNDAKEYVKQIVSLDDEKVRRDLVENAQAHIEKYDWDKSAKKLLDIMTELTIV